MKLNVISVGFIIFMILVAHIVVPEPYNWRRNTISELASQGYKRKWIMQAGFIGFGALLAIGIILNIRIHRAQWFLELPLLVYAVSVLLSGIFCAKPFIDGLPFSETEARLHSTFAQIAGVAFSLALLLHGVADQEIWRKIGHAVTLIFVLASSIVFGLTSTNAGLVQRILYAGSFAWLVFLYNTSQLGSKT